MTFKIFNGTDNKKKIREDGSRYDEFHDCFSNYVNFRNFHRHEDNIKNENGCKGISTLIKKTFLGWLIAP